ncbi:alkyldihydroxyacetonephosphate synthase [Virgisporangium ochraceum]|uniref:Alkyldihydroxyacetonephosphate synthase n=1 Tax=Virgisporangium ochraceum TaxID=65505 RepID=A0A8J3ZX53_9ACTN|nr:alkyldihydroxyacetonephosphate synthase [Virgisporangium ochraceum]
MPVRSWWGWGRVDRALDDGQLRALGEQVGLLLPLDGAVTPVPDVPPLPPPRIRPPASLASLVTDDDRDRAGHAYGKAYRDVVRALAGRVDHPPDLVARPDTDAAVAALLDWAGDTGTAVVPYGGGSSVVGGVEYRGTGPWLSLDLGRLAGVSEVDPVNHAARVGAGTFGPAVEAGLRPHDLTLRHFPQSFEFSTVGGWVATRAGGHFATGPTHIDDLVQALRVVTPIGVNETLRVPASGAGPAPDRLFLGSEGILGVITAAWLRVRRRPRFTAAAAIRFEHDADGRAAARAIVQSGLQPANCRLLDPLEAAIQAGVTDGGARLLLGFESADVPVDPLLARAVDISRAHGGTGETTGGGTGGAWREAFLRAPYVRDALVRLGVMVETVETACAWDRFDDLRDAVVDAAGPRGSTVVTYRLTHVYPDGPAPYFTILAPAPRGAEVDRWDEVKRAVNDAIAAHGGTVTHHHAVGRDHRRWYDTERPEPFHAALRAAKAALDPRGVLNPGVLIG